MNTKKKPTLKHLLLNNNNPDLTRPARKFLIRKTIWSSFTFTVGNEPNYSVSGAWDIANDSRETIAINKAF